MLKDESSPSDHTLRGCLRRRTGRMWNNADGGNLMAQMHVQVDPHSTTCLSGRDGCIIREDAGFYGGVFRCTMSARKFGKHRSFDTLGRGWNYGIAIGMGMNGLRPVAEIQFADYIFPGFDQITNELANSDTDLVANIVHQLPSTPCGGGIRWTLSQSIS